MVFLGVTDLTVRSLFPDAARMVLPFLTSCSVRPGLNWLKQNLLCYFSLFKYYSTVVEIYKARYMQVLNKYKLQAVMANKAKLSLHHFIQAFIFAFCKISLAFTSYGCVQQAQKYQPSLLFLPESPEVTFLSGERNTLDTLKLLFYLTYFR